MGYQDGQYLNLIEQHLQKILEVLKRIEIELTEINLHTPAD